MPRLLRSLTLLLFIGLISAIAGTSIAAAPTTEESDHIALRSMVPVYEQAVTNGKPEELKPYMDPAFTGVMLTGDVLDSPVSVDAYWAKLRDLLGPDGAYRVKVNVAGPAMIDHDLAIASGTTNETVDAKGQHYEFQSQWTAVCRKGTDGWKLLRIQATIDPIFNPFVKTAVRRTMLTSAGVAGIAGLVIGIVLAAIVFRRRAAGGSRA